VLGPHGSSLATGRCDLVLAVPVDWGRFVRLSAADACEQARIGALDLTWEPAVEEPGEDVGTGVESYGQDGARRPETGRQGDNGGVVEAKTGAGF